MNKGIKIASGDVIGLLNSDDVYANENVLEEINNKFEETNCDGTYANLVFKDEKLNKSIRIWRNPKGKLTIEWPPAHPTLYLKKEVYNKIGGYSLKYKISSDYDFMLRIMKNKDIKLEFIDKYIVYMRTGGTSTDGFKGYYKSLKEFHKVLINNKIKHPYLVDFKRIIKTLTEMIICKFKKKDNL